MRETSRGQDKKPGDNNNPEYQIERLHIIGDQKPNTGLKNKVKGFQFKNVLEIMDPITKTVVREPMKPFMVNQLTIAFERDKIMLSPFDEVLHKQLIDYEIERVSQTGVPIYSSKDEHYVDALGLAYLAFVLEFKQLTNTVQAPVFSSKIITTPVQLGQARANAALRDISAPANPWGKSLIDDPRELKGDKPGWVKVPLGAKIGVQTVNSWGNRAGSGMSHNGGGRSSW